MDFADRIKDVTDKVGEAAVEHEEQLRRAIDKAGATADEKTGGAYSEQIANAKAKAGALVDKLTAEKTGAEPPSGG